ncbi:LOW QUALITY PROTEIN: putative disease resistance protein RGA3 [Momordica charantia]|uniref:LOW QUALITY PROTEIN: putative disease resistance protein RGA3 n=1 Tax=Momordica charantia TaxID=3673 RepID=A0A6J1CTJ8_MOMCH|nr:LOW QUALITY PROTEIN: putative disease resistance protein RGA3 [Momordica charantia]
MAEFLWTFGVQEVLKKTVKFAAEQIGLAWGFNEELIKLRDSLLMVEAIVHDVDRIKSQYPGVKPWLEKLQDIVFEADVLLEDLAYEHLRRNVETSKKAMVSSFASSSKNPLVFRLKMANKTKAIAKKLHDHYCLGSVVGLVAITSKQTETESEPSDHLSQMLETDSFLDDIGVIGRETEVSEIVNELIELSNREEAMSVLPIVGMGGLGKTFLAKAIMNHEKIMENFDTTIWVSVSEPFVVKKILKVILETLDANFSGVDSKEVLLKELQKLLHDKKYILVLDDVWNENPNLWNELKTCLLKITPKFGCAVVVTTRMCSCSDYKDDEVAEIMETCGRHHLKKLSNDHCRSLFKKCAFGNELLIFPQLDVIWEELAKKFGGIPLVVKVFGGMVKLDKNNNHKGLKSTLENLMRIPLPDEKMVLSTIKLSVDRLPSSSLKQCFTYCSNFPRDFYFKKEELIQMWIAQRFIPLPEESHVTMENIGDKYFNMLLSRSLFQDVIKDDRGRVIGCKMHDLVHDVACSISNYQEFKWDDLKDKKPQSDKVLEIDHGTRKLRVLTIDCHYKFAYNIKSFIYLRVLIASSYYMTKVPDSIAKLKHLRYFDISETSICELPESISLLYNLQTLKLGKVKDLPKELGKLTSLRHLEFSFHSYNPFQFPPNFGQLIQLQTLTRFIVGFDKGHKIEELGPLKNLKGKISLLHLERVESKKEAMAANLVEKDNISDLYFEWNWGEEREAGKNYNDDLDVLEGLQPHKNLQTLGIRKFPGKIMPNAIFIENLVEIYLHGCKRCETLPMLGQLSKLEVLEICGLISITSIGDEFYGDYRTTCFFPKLRTFEIQEMDTLRHWEEIGGGNGISKSNNFTSFPVLESLCILCCPEMKNTPNIIQASPKLRSLVIWECGELTNLPKGIEFCSSLENMCIYRCGNVKFPLNDLQNMHRLCFLGMSEFSELPKGLATIPNLKILSVHKELQSYDWSPVVQLDSLQHLFFDLDTQLGWQVEQFLIWSSTTTWNSDTNGSTVRTRKFAALLFKETVFRYLMPVSNLATLKSLPVCECSQIQLDHRGHFERVKVSHLPCSNCSTPLLHIS